MKESVITYRKDLEHFIKYVVIGLVNTIVGYGLIFFLMFVNVDPFLSNAIGYVVGIIVSYLLNKNFNFRANVPVVSSFIKFALVLVSSWLVNIVVLFACLNHLHINKYISQIIAGSVYTSLGFLGSRFIVFHEAVPKPANSAG